MSVLRTLVAASLFAVAPFLTGPASADVHASAIYDGTEECGVITLHAAPGTSYQIFVEQASGMSAVIAAGTVGPSGAASVSVAPVGLVGNGNPTLKARIYAYPNPIWVTVQASDDYLWAWA